MHAHAWWWLAAIEHLFYADLTCVVYSCKVPTRQGVNKGRRPTTSLLKVMQYASKPNRQQASSVTSMNSIQDICEASQDNSKRPVSEDVQNRISSLT